MRVAVITGSRADWGALGMVAAALRDASCDVTVIASTSTHQDAISADGFAARFTPIPEREFPRPLGMQVGDVVYGVSDALNDLRPDIAVILGDRWDALAAAQACTLAGVPIAHLSGGDVTLGSYDDGMRDAITKLSHLHFPTNDWAHERIVDVLGEPRHRVWNVGAPALDRARNAKLLDRAVLKRALGIHQPAFVVINWQPETRSAEPNRGLINILAQPALQNPEWHKVIVGPNIDDGSDDAADIAVAYSVEHADCAEFHHSLDPIVYLSALSQCLFLIGNSSSGIYECPVFERWSIDVGERQAGRRRGRSVLHAASDTPVAIGDAIAVAMCAAPRYTDSFYGTGRACDKIVNVLRGISDPKLLLDKRPRNV